MVDQNWDYQDLLFAVRQLPLDQQLKLMEELSRTVMSELTSKSKRSSLRELRGILKPEGEIPSDNELSDAYTRYLIEKYT